MFNKALIFVAIGIALSACKSSAVPPAPTPVAVAAAKASANSVPPLTTGPNEILISPNLALTDPTMVLGALVDIGSGNVFLNNFLNASAKPSVKQLSDVILDNVLDQSLDVSASYLSFLKADITTSSTDEVSVIKTSQATIARTDLDTAALQTYLNGLSAADRANKAIVCAYIDVTISSKKLTKNGATANASGMGAAIGGSWYANTTNTAVSHQLIAVVTTFALVNAPAPPVPAGPGAPVGPSLLDITKAAVLNHSPEASVLRNLNKAKLDVKTDVLH